MVEIRVPRFGSNLRYFFNHFKRGILVFLTVLIIGGLAAAAYFAGDTEQDDNQNQSGQPAAEQQNQGSQSQANQPAQNQPNQATPPSAAPSTTPNSGSVPTTTPVTGPETIADTGPEILYLIAPAVLASVVMIHRRSHQDLVRAQLQT